MSGKLEIQALVRKLNNYRDNYYNENKSIVSDKEYDDLYDELVKLEEKTGIVFSNSPTVSVGYTVQSKLNKVTHDHPMLSLNKTKNLNDIIKFKENKNIVSMLKMDGLTLTLRYGVLGNLIKAETRGNGEIGEDVLENAKFISNIPLKINNNGVPLTIDGEIIIDYDNFEEINNKLEINERYSHPRNLAAGSIRQLDTSITASRKLKFIAWKVIEGIEGNSFSEKLIKSEELGFEIVPYHLIKENDINTLNNIVESLQNKSKELKYPIDGIVFTYDDIEYGASKGSTSHHPLHSIAYKFYNETQETTLTDIEWNTTRTGIISPVAIFDPVEIEGSIVSRATLHNVSILKSLELGIGDTITVYKANQIIPAISDNYTRSNTYKIPETCPCCGSKTIINKNPNSGTEVRYCVNPNCSSKMLSKFVHFVQRDCMNIEGLSESTLEKIIEMGYIKKYKDIYNLKDHRASLINLDNFGEKSVDKLLLSIENSRNVKLENYLFALGIKNIGKKASKDLSNFVNGDYDTLIQNLYEGIDFTVIPDFGSVMEDSLYQWYDSLKNDPDENNEILELNLIEELNFIRPVDKKNEKNDFINGKTFCVTGAFNTMKRYEIESIITSFGGKLTGSVSKNTNYLLTNEIDSGSSKAKKAKELGTPVMNEEEFLKRIK